MPGFNPDNINIHDLTIEEPEKNQAAFFDPEKEITKEIKEKFIRRYEKLRESDHRPDYISLGAYLAIIGSKQEVSESDKKRFEKLGKLPGNNPGIQYAELVANLKIIGEEYDWMDKGWGQIKKRLSELGRDSSQMSYTFLQLAADMKVAGHDPELSDQDWKNVYDDFSRTRIEGSGFPLEKMAANIRILGKDPQLTDEEWHRMVRSFKYYKAGEVSYGPSDYDKERVVDGFAREAAAMTILSADEIIIPEDGGLKLVHHKESGSQSEELHMPEARKF